MFRPLSNRLIVVPEVESDRYGSLFIVRSGPEKPMIGTVIAAGPGKTDNKGRFAENTVKPGQKIMFGRVAPQQFTHEGDTYMHLCEQDVLFVME